MRATATVVRPDKLRADRKNDLIDQSFYYDGKALTHILDNYPRDELHQITERELYNNAIGILRLQERQQRDVIRQLLAERAMLKPAQRTALAELLIRQEPAETLEARLHGR